jgi:hypothetical protein
VKYISGEKCTIAKDPHHENTVIKILIFGF